MAKGKITVPHKCPKCDREAKNHNELEKEFGFRNMNPSTIRSQSWCKKCRSKKND